MFPKAVASLGILNDRAAEPASCVFECNLGWALDRVERRWRKEHPHDRPYTIEEIRAMAAESIRDQFLYQQGRSR